MTLLLRASKGLAMGMLFFAFGTMILVGLLFMMPVVLVALAFHRLDRERVQGVNRVWMGWWLKGLALAGLMKVEQIEGRPVDPPSVIVANHPGLFDVIVLITEIPRMSVMVKRSLVQKLPLGPLLWSAGYVYGPRKGDLKDLKDFFGRAEDMLRQGYHFMIFPEGTRSPKGGLLPFKSGAFVLARRAGVPIQPVLIENDPPFLPHEDRWYWPLPVRSPVKVRFLDPIPPPERGAERKLASRMEDMFRRKLGIGAREEDGADSQAAHEVAGVDEPSNKSEARHVERDQSGRDGNRFENAHRQQHGGSG